MSIRISFCNPAGGWHSITDQTSLLRDDGECANGKRNDNVTVNNEEDAVFFGEVEIENLVAVSGDACEFVATQRRMSPIRREEGEFSASGALISGGRLRNSRLNPTVRR
jgi:hypothetical protein